MALVRTTLASACTAADSSIVVTTATGFAAGYTVRVDQEVMKIAATYVSGTTIPVLRGKLGTAVVAHGVYAGVICGTAADWGDQGIQTVTMFPVAGRVRNIHSYGASGAISLPLPGCDEVAFLNYTSTLTMTLADPTKDLDGCIMWIVADGNGAHTVSNAAGSGMGGAGGSYDIFTFNGSGMAGVQLMAINSKWVMLGNVSGTLTNVVAGLA